MVQLKHKPKQQQITKRKHKISLKTPKTKDKSKHLEIWKQEALELSKTKFESTEQAISVLLDRVIAKLNLTSSRSKTKKFLLDLFETDPELKEELSAIFKG